MSIYGQECQTVDGGPYYNNNYSGSYTGSANTPITIKVYIWAVTNNIGTTTELQAYQAQEALRQYFNPIGIYFDFCIGSFVGTPSNGWVTNSFDDGINVYVTPGVAGGIADGLVSLNCTVTPVASSAIVHEVGHCLGLSHTFAGGKCPADANSELAPTLDITGNYVNSPNCATSGDFVCDTPAEPSGPGGNECYQYNTGFLNGCEFQNNNNYLDFAGNPYIDPYNALPRNIMSYNGGCRTLFTEGQNMRMRDMIAGAPILANIERPYQTNAIESTISSNTTWDTDRSFNHDVVVEEGVGLVVTADIKFTAGTGIRFERGSWLEIDGGSFDLDFIRESCEPTSMTTWRGIEVETDDNTQSTVILYNNATIKNADVAINILGSGSVWTFIKDSYFINNRISLQASNNTFVQPYVRNTEFKIETGYLPVSQFGQVTLENCNRIFFGSCTFTNTLNSPNSGSAFISFNTGITSIDTDFFGWEKALNINSASDKTAYFNLCEFDLNRIGIVAVNFNNTLIRNSFFDIHTTQYGGIHRGIDIGSSRGTRILQNEFEAFSSNIDSRGTYSVNIQGNQLYNNNKFTGLTIANDVVNGGNGFNGLLFECNDLNSNGRDFDVELGLKNHGSDANAIGNKFSHNNNGDPGSDFTISDFFHDFRYFHEDGNAEETPMFTSGFDATGINDQSDCNYPNVVNDPPTTGTLTPFHVKHTEFTNGINTATNYIDANADGGDTDGLVINVNTNSASNSAQVYNTLMNLSPWVSASIGQAVISNSQYYTESQLASLYVSNSYWLQDEVLYAFVNGPSSPLSSTSVSYINANSSPTDAQSQAYFHLSDLMHGRDVNITNAINFINTVDDSSVNYNDLRTWFDMMTGYHKEIAIAESYMTQHNYTSAVSNLSQKGSSTTYSISERNDINAYLSLLNIQIGIYNDKRNEWNLSSNEYSAIEIIANSSHPIASAKAKDILGYYYGISFPQSNTRNGKTTMYEIAKESMKSLSVYPNPASNSFNIEGVEDYIGMDIQISNIYGDMIYSERITGIKIGENFENGLYIITVTDNGRKVASGKIIIVK